MCLAIPMMFVERRGDDLGVVELSGVRREVHIGLVDDIEPGDYVLVHAGFVIEKLDPERAQADLKLLNEIYDRSPRGERP